MLTATLLSVTPGPGMLYIAAQTVGPGRRAGWYSALGTHLASYVHIIAGAIGISALLHAVPVAYLALKVAGAAYLIWLGLRFLLAEGSMSDRAPGLADGAPRALRDSVVVELTKPKSAVFFLAFLPQFADPAAAMPVWVQIIVLGSIANLIFSVGEFACVVFADRVAGAIRASRAVGRWMRRAAGSILVGLVVNLLVADR